MPCLRMNTEESRDVKRTDADDKPQVRDSATAMLKMLYHLYMGGSTQAQVVWVYSPRRIGPNLRCIPSWRHVGETAASRSRCNDNGEYCRAHDAIW